MLLNAFSSAPNDQPCPIPHVYCSMINMINAAATITTCSVQMALSTQTQLVHCYCESVMHSCHEAPCKSCSSILQASQARPPMKLPKPCAAAGQPRSRCCAGIHEAILEQMMPHGRCMTRGEACPASTAITVDSHLPHTCQSRTPGQHSGTA